MRADGRRIKTLDPLFEIVPHIIPKRYDSQVFFETDLDYTSAKKYINAQRKTGQKISFMAILIAAYVRTASQMPEINRFVMRRKIFARNEFTVSFVVLKTDGTQEDRLETAVKVKFDLNDTIFDVAKKIDEIIVSNRKFDTVTFTDKLAKFFMSVPLLPGILVSLVKGLDKLGWLPKAFLDGSPFHTSLWITNMASINMGSVYHHLYDFGTSSMFFGLGKMKDVTREGGRKQRVIPVGVVADERICAGVTFAKVFSIASRYIADPTLLETPPESIREDIK